MTTDCDDVCPYSLSDEEAAEMSDCLYMPAAACENSYLTQLNRHDAQQQVLVDPQQPWKKNMG
jgi:hypothetical protein